MRQFNNISIIERIISAATYLTAGMAGFIWLIIALVIKKKITNFLMYHVMQSIFISIAYFLFIELYKLVYIILIKIPVIGVLFGALNGLLFSPQVFLYGMSLMSAFTTAVILYLAITSFCGQYSYLPWVSNIIKNSTNR